MEKGVRKKTRKVTIGAAIVFLCACVGANATVGLDVNAMQISIPGQFYSYSAGSGSLNFSSRPCSVPTLVFADGSSNYSITLPKLTFSSALVTDTSQNYMASGLFQGGNTLTLTGGLKYKPTNTTILPTGSTLIVANMSMTSNETWLLQELPAATINGSIYFIPNTTVGFGMGITYGTDILKIEQFRLDFSFKGLSPNPNDFSTGNISGTTSTIGIAATAPEPATVFLFTMAALAFRINKKK